MVTIWASHWRFLGCSEPHSAMSLTLVSFVAVAELVHAHLVDLFRGKLTLSPWKLVKTRNFMYFTWVTYLWMCCRSHSVTVSWALFIQEWCVKFGAANTSTSNYSSVPRKFVLVGYPSLTDVARFRTLAAKLESQGILSCKLGALCRPVHWIQLIGVTRGRTGLVLWKLKNIYMLLTRTLPPSSWISYAGTGFVKTLPCRTTFLQPFPFAVCY